MSNYPPSFSLIHTERIFMGRSHIARVAEARLEQINRYTQVSPGARALKEYFVSSTRVSAWL